MLYEFSNFINSQDHLNVLTGPQKRLGRQLALSGWEAARLMSLKPETAFLSCYIKTYYDNLNNSNKTILKIVMTIKADDEQIEALGVVQKAKHPALIREGKEEGVSLHFVPQPEGLER